MNTTDSNNNNNNKHENSSYTCPPFPNKEAAHNYQSSLAPPRDLICPITQELFLDPVIAIGDGYTYERQAIQTWFHAQRQGRLDGSSSAHGDNGGASVNNGPMVRSPVSNAYMDNRQNQQCGLVENLVVAGLTRDFKERLGEELCRRCQLVHQHYHKSNKNVNTNRSTNRSTSTMDGNEDGEIHSDHSNDDDDDFKMVLGDGGFRIKCLIETGADLSLKTCSGGNTAFMVLIQTGQLDLVNFFLLHEVPVTITNDDGHDPIRLVEQYIERNTNHENIMAWREVLAQLLQIQRTQQHKLELQSKARDDANSELRQRQRSMENQANDQQERRRQESNGDGSNTSMNGGWSGGGGLGRMDEYGWGFFPCLAALQFQGSVPEPSASFRDVELREKRRLRWIMRFVGFCVFSLWVVL